MSEQKNGFGSMEFGTENSLEALFGSFSAPPVDLGDAGAQAATEVAETNAKQEVMSEKPQAEESTSQATAQMPQTQPKATATPVEPESYAPQSAQTTGQVIDLFGAVAEEDADAMLAKLAGKPPVFEYGSIKDEISDPTLTFEQLRVKMAADCPELEARAHVSWTVSYAGITERVSDAENSIFEVKAKIEKSKKFKEAIKKLKPKDKEPVCAVKPTVTAQKKACCRSQLTRGYLSARSRPRSRIRRSPISQHGMAKCTRCGATRSVHLSHRRSVLQNWMTSGQAFK